MKVKGTAWISTDNVDEYWAEGSACETEVERTEENEVRIGIVLTGNATDDATLYLTLGEASRLAHFLGAAVVQSGVTV